MSPPAAGKLLCVGLRGARPGDRLLHQDLDACARAGVGGVILFDVDVPEMRVLQAKDVGAEEAAARSSRNILDPAQLATLIAHIRERLGPDIWVSVDQEGGRVARLSRRRGFPASPSAAEFAQMDRPSQAAAARQHAQQLRDLGFDLDFAPCVDLALEPANEIIVATGRSYGADADAVVDAASLVLDAHAASGVAACLKHFPGHGSSLADSHHGAVDITSTWSREAELEPYVRLATRPGVAVMVAHLVHRAVDPRRPASLSKIWIDQWLRGALGFDGVVVTDSIDMRAIADHFSAEEAAVAAIEAGADLVIDGFNLTERDEHPAPRLASALQSAFDDDRIEASLARLAHLRTQIWRAA